jgi:hypothetical protein
VKTSREQIEFWRRVQLWGLIVLVAAVCVLAAVAVQTHVALCSFRGDLERRADELAFYLNEAPGPFPLEEFGLRIPRDDLKRTLDQQRETLNSLRWLWCE